MRHDNMTRIRIGLVHLTDMAPAFVAEAKGFFAAEGIEASLSVEPSWANIADKLTYRALDAAIMLAPLAFAIALGLRGGAATPLLVPLAISRNGNSITVSRELAAAVGTGNVMAVGRSLAAHIAAGGPRLRIAVVHAYSSHDLLLRYWLAACGIDPVEDIDLVAVPPVDMVAALRAGEIDGFCAGAPWGAVATAEDVGRTIVLSSSIWRGHPEKCFGVTADWAERHPAALQAVLRALLRALAYCDDPANADEIAGLLAAPERLSVPVAALRASLPGAPAEGGVDISRFSDGAPRLAHAAWFLQQMARWGRFGAEVDQVALARAVYRPDLYEQASGTAITPPSGPELFCDRSAP